MRSPLKGGNWGLKILALVLAVVIYHAIKSDLSSASTHDTSFFQHTR